MLLFYFLTPDYFARRRCEISPKSGFEGGASAVEVALLISLVGIVCLASLRLMGRQVGCLVGTASDALAGSGMTYDTALVCCPARISMSICGRVGCQVRVSCS